MKRFLRAFGYMMIVLAIIDLIVILITRIIKWEFNLSYIAWTLVICSANFLGIWIGRQLIIYNQDK